jgi:hypothetical protein
MAIQGSRASYSEPSISGRVPPHAPCRFALTHAHHSGQRQADGRARKERECGRQMQFYTGGNSPGSPLPQRPPPGPNSAGYGGNRVLAARPCYRFRVPRGSPDTFLATPLPAVRPDGDRLRASSLPDSLLNVQCVPPTTRATEGPRRFLGVQVLRVLHSEFLKERDPPQQTPIASRNPSRLSTLGKTASLLRRWRQHQAKVVGPY